MQKQAIRYEWCRFEELSLRLLYDCMVLRQQVFIAEQGVSCPDADGLDPQALHLLGWRGEELISYARIFPPGQLRSEAVVGRVLVRAEARGEGLGHALMLECIVHLQAPIYLSAQSQLRSFYERLGFKICGPEYEEASLPHLPMRRGVY